MFEMLPDSAVVILGPLMLFLCTKHTTNRVSRLHFYDVRVFYMHKHEMTSHPAALFFEHEVLPEIIWGTFFNANNISE